MLKLQLLLRFVVISVLYHIRYGGVFAEIPSNLLYSIQDETELKFMRRAVSLASLALGRTSPNPCVGCVLVDKNGEIVGEGYHQKAGEAHAEVHALKQAGDRAVGATAYVSLEPCNHYGRTPPCSHALLQ